MSMNKTNYTYLEAAEASGVEQDTILIWIQNEWLEPSEINVLDFEDIARLRLIRDLRFDLGTNDAAVPIILHLIDQLCHMREQMRRIELIRRS